jgi:hypothetical protein
MVMFQVRLTQPELGFTKSNIQPLKYLKEFRVDENNEFKRNVDSFSRSTCKYKR